MNIMADIKSLYRQQHFPCYVNVIRISFCFDYTLSVYCNDRAAVLEMFETDVGYQSYVFSSSYKMV